MHKDNLSTQHKRGNAVLKKILYVVVSAGVL